MRIELNETRVTNNRTVFTERHGQRNEILCMCLFGSFSISQHQGMYRARVGAIWDENVENRDEFPTLEEAVEDLKLGASSVLDEFFQHIVNFNYPNEVEITAVRMEVPVPAPERPAEEEFFRPLGAERGFVEVNRGRGVPPRGVRFQNDPVEARARNVAEQIERVQVRIADMERARGADAPFGNAAQELPDPAQFAQAWYNDMQQAIAHGGQDAILRQEPRENPQQRLERLNRELQGARNPGDAQRIRQQIQQAIVDRRMEQRNAE